MGQLTSKDRGIDKPYTATLLSPSGRQGWTVTFRHPALLDRTTGKPGRRIHRGLNTRDKADAEKLGEEINELLRNPSYWKTSARADAEHRFDPRVVSIFFEKLEPESYDPTALRDQFIELPSADSADYRRVLLLGTTGAGKTTLVRQLIGTNSLSERFPSTSINKTTVADTELAVNDGAYRAVVTFLSEDEVRDSLQECISAAVLAAYRNAPDREILRRLLEHVSQRLRLSHVLGTPKEATPEDEIDELLENNTDDGDLPDHPTGIDLEATHRLLADIVRDLRIVARHHGETIRLELEASTESDERVVDEIFEEELDNRLRDDEEFHAIADRLMEEIALRFDLLQVGKVRRTKHGWPESWQWQTAERDVFLREVRRLSSNSAQEFGYLLTPLVNGIRIAGPFRPTWHVGEPPRLVLFDTEGLGHAPDSSASVSTSITKRFEDVDAVLLVDNAAQPMLAAPVAAMRALVSSGNAGKLLVCFTHAELVKGPNILTVRAAEQHVLASAENVLASIGEELGPFAERLLRRRLESASFFLGHIDEELDTNSKRDRRTVAQLRKLLEALLAITERPEAAPARPVYDRLNLVLAVKAAAEDFHEFWLPRLGLKFRPGIPKEHWARVKALNRRLAEGWADEYATLRPVADLHRQLQSRFYVLIQNPLKWNGAEPNDDGKQQIYDAFADKISRRLLELSTRRLWKERDTGWKEAFGLSGRGSTFVRALSIANDIYEPAVPIPDIAASPDRNEFLHQVVAAVQEAAEETGVQLI